MKKQKENFRYCEDCNKNPCTRSYDEGNGQYTMLCQRCYDVRVLKEPPKNDEVII